MKNIFGWYVLLFYLLPLMLLVPLIKKRRHIVSGLLEQQALKRNGTVKKMLGIPYYLEFSVDGNPVSLTLSHGGKNSPPTTAFMADVNFLNSFHMSVGPENVISKLGKKLGGQDIQIMNPQFDDAFIIKGSDENRIRTLLSHEVQTMITQWKDSVPSLYIHNNKFRFSISKLIQEDELLDQFIASAILIYQKSLEIT